MDDEKLPASSTPSAAASTVLPESADAKAIRAGLDASLLGSDGGYGWVNVACVFFQNACTWGLNSTFGIYLSFYTSNNYFPGSTNLQYAFIGGLSISTAFLFSPFATFLGSQTRLGFKMPMMCGLIIFPLSQILSGLTHKIWQLFLTQGLMFGLGMSLIFAPPLPILSQYFTKKRAFANGIASSGSGAGALAFSFITRINIERLGLKLAFIINGCISFAILLPCVILARARFPRSHVDPYDYNLFKNVEFIFFELWAIFSVIAYVVGVYSVATYATNGLGLSQSQANTCQAVLAAGQILGRPMTGFLLDWGGRINMTAILTLMAGITYLAVWLNAKAFGVLVFFALCQGLFGGVIWASIGSLLSENPAVGVTKLGSALAMTWIILTLPATFSEAIAVGLADYSRDRLGLTGADVYRITIATTGGMFVAASLCLLVCKRVHQGSWNLQAKT